MATIAENIQTLRSIKSDIKNAIIQKGGSVTDAFGTYAQAITNLPSGGGGGTENEDALVMRTISVYSNDRVSRVGNYIFALNYNLSSVNLLNCKYIGDYAFSGCYSLTYINIPLCNFVGFNAFAYCNKLASINLPLCISLMQSAFLNCSGLQFITLPNCSYVGDGAFLMCSKLQYIDLPLCIEFRKNLWGDCSVFAECSALSIVKIPLCSYIGENTFMNCINLKEVYLNSVTSVATISANTFSNCSNLTSVYVPSSLVDAFKTAQYWSSISSKIVGYRDPSEPTEPTKYPPLIYSAKSAGSTITVNGETVTLEQGDNITLDYPNEITSVKATSNTALTYIQIPNTVVSINDNAFTGCTELTDFRYNGTVEEWGAITLGTDWNKDAPFTVVHCTDGDVTLEEPIQPIQHEYVDLGLPSGLKWAKCNVGAKKETDYGDYFMWGSTEPNNNTNCDWPTAPFNNGSRDYDSTYFNSVKNTVCPNGILAKEYDAAAQIMGGGWRMPTTNDMQELFNNTTNEWTQVNGVNGMKFTSRTDTSKYIFIPAAGNRVGNQMTVLDRVVLVWSSSLNTTKPKNAFCMNLASDHVNMKSYDSRSLGRSVRGVHK